MKDTFSKWLLVSIAVMVVLSLGLTRGVYAESTLDKIKTRGYMIAGCKDQVIPFGFKDEAGNIVGFDVDICQYIVNKLGVKLKIVPVTSATRVPLVQEGTVDIAAATATHTKSRDEVVDFSITYFYDGQKILVKKGSGIKSYKDLAGKNVGSAKGSTSEKNIATIQPAAKIISFKEYQDAFRALEDGVVDAVTTDSSILVGLRVASKNPTDYEIVGEFFSEEPYGLILPQNDAKWRDFVNECLIEMWNSGEWLKAYNKWFGPGTKYAIPLDFKMSTWPLR
jgi:polar amino acid transport system substrate-binding protein